MGLTVMENAEEDEDISVKGPVFLKKKKPRISKQFVYRKIKRYRVVIQSENYETW